MNNLLFVFSIFITFSILIIVHKNFKAPGIFGFMGITSILANIFVIKNVTIFGIEVTLGTVMFASNFLATDILSECYGEKVAKKGVIFSLLAIFGYLLASQFALLYIPNASDIAQPIYQALFTLTPRITLSSILMFFIANYTDVILYNFLKKKTNNKYMWLRNNICTILTNGLENFLFTAFALGGIYSFKEIIMFSIGGTILEIIVALCDTPFLYIAKHLSKE